MKKNNLLITICLLFSINAFSQRQQGVYLEVLGASTSIGVHYDTRFGESTRWGGRIGFAYTNSSSEDFFEFGPTKTKGVSFPIAINYLIGNMKNSFELGVGFSYGFYSCNEYENGKTINKNVTGTFGFLDLGYRYQSDKGLLLRVGGNIGVTYDNSLKPNKKTYGADRSAVIYPYISIGYKF